MSIHVGLLAQIDARAAALGLNRSQYLAQLARNDVASGGDLVLRDTPPPTATDSPRLPAVPAKQTETSYLRRKRKRKKP